MQHITINGREIGSNCPPYIIAEMSANHNGKIENAFEIIKLAKQCGADAVKIQTYTADTITLNSRAPEFMISGGLWHGQSLHELYQKAYTPWEWHAPMFEFAKEQGITIFSSPFDFSAVDLLEKLNAPAYKIASFEAVDLPLIRYVAQTGKPMILSTGMANEEEIFEAIDTAQSNGCRELVVLHCGACVIEKHFTLDRNGGGADDSFSLEAADLHALCRDSRTAWQSLGKASYLLKDSEKGNVKFRRSLYFVKDLKQGDVIDETCIRSVRPGFGLPPKYFDALMGKTLARDVAKNTATHWEDITEGKIS